MRWVRSPSARFFPFEGSCGYLWLLERVVRCYGIPVSVYQDRHGSLCRNGTNWSLEEQLAGRREPARVEVRQLLDVSWRVYYGDRLIAKHQSTVLNEPVRALETQLQGQGGRSYNRVYVASAPHTP